MSNWQNELCVCGKHYKNIHPVWHGWKINWQKIKSKLTNDSRKLLKEEFICNVCKDKIKAEIKTII